MSRSRPLLALVALVGLLVATACSASGDDDATSTTVRPTTDRPTTSRQADDCSPGRRPASPQRTQSIDVAGSERRYLLDLPAGYDGTTAAPLVFDVHGFGSNALEHDGRTEMAAKGTARGYVVVTPQATGVPATWRLFDPAPPDDYGFLRALRARLEQELCVDADRVYAAGHSAGSAFSGFLVCRERYEWAGVAMVSAAVPSTCPAGARPAVMAIAGTGDLGVPYEGGIVAGSIQPIGGFLDTFEAHVDHYGCSERPESSRPEAGVVRRTVDGCDLGAALQFDTVVGGTHAWPGSLAAATDPAASPEAKAWDATSAILDFFDANPLRR